MLAPLLAVQAPTDTLYRQPTTMEVIGYQRVRYTLPDGRPDLKAPDNYFVRTKTQWFLIVDSDTLPLDENGNRHIVVPPYRETFYVRSTETGRPRGKLAAAFKEISAPSRGENGKAVVRNSGTFSGSDEFRPAQQRVLHWRIRSVAERVETHTLGGRRATRTTTKAHWGVSTVGWPTGKVFVPDSEPWVQMEAKPHVQVDPPTYGFGEFTLPADDDL